MKRFVVGLGLIVALLFIFQGASQPDDQWDRQLKKYAKIYSLIKEIYPGEVDVEKLVFASVKGLLQTLDPHSYFLDPATYRTINEEQQGNYYGIGIRITKYEDRLTVVTPLKDTPAYKLGVLPGDVITEIDGQSTETMRMDEVLRRLRGDKGTHVNIKIFREGLAKPISFRIKRAEIPLNSISYALVVPNAPKIGYISIRTFGHTTAGEFKENLEKLLAENNINALILDLRGNTGGSLYAAVDVADFFLPRGKVIVTIKGRTIEHSFSAREDNQFEDLTLAVLINRTSASASEIVASALKDHQRATIVGTRSWGKGLVESVNQLSLNSALALTTARYYTASEKCLQRDFSRLDDYLFFLGQANYDHNQDIQGGVMPDVYVRGNEFPPLIIDLISKGAFFSFSRKLIESDKKIEKDFKADTEVLEQFKHFLKENNIHYDASEFNRHLAAIQSQIERDVLTNKFSSLEGAGIFLKSDPVTQKAIEILREKSTERSSHGET
jgi:carboxyl-terminal processing protease